MLALLCMPAFSQDRYPGKNWEHALSVEALGWSSKKLKAAREYSELIGSSAVMIIVDGLVLDQWGQTTRRFRCHSIRKSFLSALYGIHVKEGRIDLLKTLQTLGIDDTYPSLTPLEKEATIEDLLKARSGVYHPALYETAVMATLRPERGSHPPGAFWYYNNWDFNALGTIFEQETKTRIFEEFRRRVADPLQMQDFRLEDGSYFQGPQSIHPAYPFRMSARDMARFGLLFLRAGKWREGQLIPKQWVIKGTRSYSGAGDDGGYGYMWWVAVKGKHFPLVHLKDGAFSARGAGGHFLLVVPDDDLVIVHRTDTDTPAGRQVTGSQCGMLLKLIFDSWQGGSETSH